MLSIASVSVNAEQYEHCNSLLEHGITNVTKHMSAEHSVAYKWHSNCGQDFESASDNSVKRASISIFGYGSGGAGANSSHTRTRLKEWCNKNSNFAASRQDLFEEARIISEPALDAWNQCQNIAKKGIKITSSIQGENDDFLNFTIDSESDGTHLFYGITEIGYSCKIQGKNGEEMASDRINRGITEVLVMTKSRPPIDNANIHISCRRNQPIIKELNGTGTLKYDQGHINVMTSGPALPLTIPRVVESYNVTPPKSVIAFNSKICPKGWSEYEPAYGRFIRGIDKSGKIDPFGKREPGSLQNDTFKSHAHFLASKHNGFYKSGEVRSHGTNGGGNYGFNQPTSTTGDKETAPKNVSLLYCEKKI